MYFCILLLFAHTISSSQLNGSDSSYTQLPGEQRLEEEGVTITAGYTCNGDSFFNSIKHSYKVEHGDACNIFKKFEAGKSDHFVGFRENKPDLKFSAEGTELFVDINGDEYLAASLTIVDTKCKGASVLYMSVNKVRIGSCAGDNGVTEVDSYPAGVAVLTIDGKCKSLCNGRSDVKYNPGKKNIN